MLQIGGGWSEKFVRFSDLLNWDWTPGLMELRSVWPALPPRFGLTAKCIGAQQQWITTNQARPWVRAALACSPNASIRSTGGIPPKGPGDW